MQRKLYAVLGTLMLSGSVVQTQAEPLDDIYYLSGVFCNHSDQARTVFKKWKENDIPIDDVIEAINEGERKPECMNVKIDLIFSKVTLVNSADKIKGEPIYLYEALFVGSVRTPDGTIMKITRSSIMYFVRARPFDPKDADTHI